jgi:hypothetical protein
VPAIEQTLIARHKIAEGIKLIIDSGEPFDLACRVMRPSCAKERHDIRGLSLGS